MEAVEVLDVYLGGTPILQVRSLSNLRHLGVAFGNPNDDLPGLVSGRCGINGDLQTIRSLTLEFDNHDHMVPVLAALANNSAHSATGFLFPFLRKLEVRMKNLEGRPSVKPLTRGLLGIYEARLNPNVSGVSSLAELELEGSGPLESYITPGSITWFREHVEFRYLNLWFVNTYFAYWESILT